MQAERDKSIKQQAMLFFIVGAFNTLFGYGLYALFLYVGFSYPLALLFATILGVLFNFKTIGKFVFNTDSCHPERSEGSPYSGDPSSQKALLRMTATHGRARKSNHLLLRFIIVYVFLYGLNFELIKLVQLLMKDPYVAGFIVIVPSAALAFILNKYLVFRDDYETR